MMLRRQDLIRLSRLAGRGEIGVEPLVLRVQADLFASVATHDPASMQAFETLALALIPKVDDETVAYVVGILGALPDTPPAILETIEARTGATARPQKPEPILDDHPALALGGHPLQALVDRAGREPDLARTLLASADLPPLEAARLYLFADRIQRADIRSALAGAGMAGRRPMRLRRPARDVVDGLLDAAENADARAFGARLADCLALARPPLWGFHESERRDLLALAVSAIGLCEEDAIRIFLTLDPEIARSVETVFGLVAIFRSTPRSVATMILEAALDLAIIPRAGAHISSQAGRDLADRPGAAARMGLIPSKAPNLREWGRQPRPHIPDKAG
jgi:hypothetical protein